MGEKEKVVPIKNDKKNDVVKLKLSRVAVAAAWNAIAQASIVKRSDARRSRRLSEAFKREGGVMFQGNAKDNPDNWSFREGTVTIDLEALEYLDDEIDVRLKAGIQGHMGHGYGELLDAIHEHLPDPEA